MSDIADAVALLRMAADAIVPAEGRAVADEAARVVPLHAHEIATALTDRAPGAALHALAERIDREASDHQPEPEPALPGWLKEGARVELEHLEGFPGTVTAVLPGGIEVQWDCQGAFHPVSCGGHKGVHPLSRLHPQSEERHDVRLERALTPEVDDPGDEQPPPTTPPAGAQWVPAVNDRVLLLEGSHYRELGGGIQHDSSHLSGPGVVTYVWEDNELNVRLDDHPDMEIATAPEFVVREGSAPASAEPAPTPAPPATTPVSSAWAASTRIGQALRVIAGVSDDDLAALPLDEVAALRRTLHERSALIEVALDRLDHAVSVAGKRDGGLA